jgi:acyl dehydratase
MANLNPDHEKALFFLEDLQAGQRFVSGTHQIDEEQIRAFAQQYDPQPFHLDPEFAKTTLFEGLVASGWHSPSFWRRGSSGRPTGDSHSCPEALPSVS